MFYDRHGIPITAEQWAHIRQHDHGYRRIARTAIMSPSLEQVTHVSTVWLGIDHRLGIGDDETLPIIFETLVDGPDQDDVVERYSTEADAESGHRRHVVDQAAQITDAIVTDVGDLEGPQTEV